MTSRSSPHSRLVSVLRVVCAKGLCTRVAQQHLSPSDSVVNDITAFLEMVISRVMAEKQEDEKKRCPFVASSLEPRGSVMAVALLSTETTRIASTWSVSAEFINKHHWRRSS
ncbi:MAG: hypothetical protein BYD32DRAFT_429214 [Podila humilis]|nr:MAG: hypothetical protein BYD32DRAFT_429214 [Podila humilis]